MKKDMLRMTSSSIISRLKDICFDGQEIGSLGGKS